MSQLSGGQPRRSGVPDIYTVLVFIAVVALLVAVVFVAMKNMALTDSSNPFAVVSMVQPAVDRPPFLC